MKMLDAHAWGLAAGYAAASVAAGYAAIHLATFGGRRVRTAAMNVLLWGAVMLIGGAGSVIRFLADGAVASAADRGLPPRALAVNVSGAVILGVITGLALGHDQALLAGTAAVGSYTTFSTWMLETQRLTEERRHRYGPCST